MHIKILGGTADNGRPSLCYTCRRATVVKGARLRDEIVQCSVLENPIAFPVTSCTTYVNRQHPSLYEMEDIAWVLRTDAKRGKIGFVQSKDLKLRDRYVLTEG
jgi:hypothetical protein